MFSKINFETINLLQKANFKKVCFKKLIYMKKVENYKLKKL